jgi:hypothetical protein
LTTIWAPRLTSGESGVQANAVMARIIGTDEHRMASGSARGAATVQHQHQPGLNTRYGNRILVMRPAGPTAQPSRRDAKPMLQYASVSSVVHVVPSSLE